MEPERALVPDEIVVSRDRGTMRLVWSDGHKAAITANALRTACRCAWCTRERIEERFSVDGDAVALADVIALGSQGLHIKFSDGHERGIFPWAYLDQLTRGIAHVRAPDAH